MDNPNNFVAAAGFHSPSTSNDDYINFDKFVAQCSNAGAMGGTLPMMMPSPLQYVPPIYNTEEVVRNSNLLPTANEFIPTSNYVNTFVPQTNVNFHNLQDIKEFIPAGSASDYTMDTSNVTNCIGTASDYQARPQTSVGAEDISNNMNELNISRKQGAIRKTTQSSRNGYYSNNRHKNNSSSHHYENKRPSSSDWKHNKQQHSSNYYNNQPSAHRNNSYNDNSGGNNNNNNNRSNNWNNRSSFNNRRYDHEHGNNNESNNYYHGGNKKKSYVAHEKKRGNNYYSKQDDRIEKNEVSNEHPKHIASNKYNQKHNEPIVPDSVSQREKLMREIDAGKLECLVCCENIKPFQSVWSCSSCFHIIHLSCIIKWANSSKDENGWRCPACQSVSLKIPKDYFCFCGKLKNPQYNRNDVAHSCGELCEKRETCEHSCKLLCHPGPCLVCHATITRQCGCGRMKKTMQCCQRDDAIACEAVCEKILNCGVHKCAAKCHLAECAPCDKQLEHKCHCGKDKKSVDCSMENNEQTKYSCGKLCNRQLACKQHNCKDICHADVCGDCKLLPASVTSCPCGKMPVLADTRKSCTEPVPLCNATCGKPLKCGQPSNPHLCSSKCHAGNCPPCGKETAVRCRCGQMEKMIKCKQLQTRADDARCKKRCAKKRNCGKHKCNQECCIDIDHICQLPCNFNLSCGKHKCNQLCHKGRCQTCYRSSFDELYCECGANVTYPPVPCGAKRPTCDRPCSRQHDCDHPVQHNCHSATACPPCMAFITTYCYGQHEQRKTIPCSQPKFSCGLKCNKPLRCGQHKCIKNCHDGPCEVDGELCKQNCTKVRHMCSHNCNAPCHSGDCPDRPCREAVEVLCQCGHRKQTRSCQEFSNEYRRIASAKLASTMEDMQRGNSIELSDVLGPIKMNNNKTLECNDDCKVIERNRRLAIGLQIRNPDLSSKLQPKYSDFIRSWAKKDPQLVHMINNKLTELVKSAKESKQKSRSHSFPTMNREKRQLVHEMCGMFGCQSVAYDAEPNRNVVANATKETTWLPSMSIFEVLQRESGQRRIPVPSNNAWKVNNS